MGGLAACGNFEGVGTVQAAFAVARTTIRSWPARLPDIVWLTNGKERVVVMDVRPKACPARGLDREIEVKKNKVVR